MTEYDSLDAGMEAVSDVGKRIAEEGLPDSVVPLICGFAGYGNVSRGAQAVYDLLPMEEIAPEDLATFFEKGEYSNKHAYKVVFKEEHMVEPISPETKFELQDYYDHPEKYRSKFESYVPYLTMLINCIYWDKRYPRLVTKKYLKDLFGGQEKPRLRMIGDISCDVEGAIEATLHITDSGNPIFVYDPATDKAIDGHEGTGPVILAVDNLPCEVARESSTYFSNILKAYVDEIVSADYTVPFEECQLPPEIKKAVIVYQGEFTPDFEYIQEFL
jgi:alpha-aminoadipic semialdehyde synthase